MADEAIVEGVKKALSNAKKRNFRESIEIAINLKDIDLTNPKNRINAEILLPKGRGKEAKVAIIGTGETALKGKESADLVLTPEDIEDLADDKKRAKKIASKINFFIAEAPLMPLVGKKLGIVLGPRGKMPRPVPPGSDPTPLIKNLRNTIKIRSKDRPTLHALVGTRDMSPEDIAENIDAVLKRVEANLEKGRHNIASVYVKTTMGPSVRIM